MNKKDILSLIFFPAVAFLSMAAGCIFFSHVCYADFQEHKVRESLADQKFELIYSQIKSGKLRVSDDKWIELMRRERKSANADYQTFLPLIDLTRRFGWYMIIFVFLNGLVVFSVRDSMRKRQKDTPAANN